MSDYDTQLRIRIEEVLAKFEAWQEFYEEEINIMTTKFALEQAIRDLKDFYEG